MKPYDLSSDTLGALFDQSMDCVQLLDPEGRVVWMNANGQTALDIEDFCAVEGGIWADFWPEAHRPTIEAAIADGAESSTHRFRGACPTQKGTLKHWDVTVSPVVSASNEHAGFLAISRDISGETDAQEALQTAMAEMRHRLTNVFATANSLMNAHLRGTESVEVFASTMSNRLSALAEVQTLFDNTRGPVRLLQIISTVLGPFQSAKCEVDIGSVPDMTLEGLAGDSVALVLGELCVHSTRNGAFGHGGTISISVRYDTPSLILDWSEDLEVEILPAARAGNRGIKVMTRIMQQRGDVLNVDIGAKNLTASLALTLDG